MVDTLSSLQGELDALHAAYRTGATAVSYDGKASLIIATPRNARGDRSDRERAQRLWWREPGAFDPREIKKRMGLSKHMSLTRASLRAPGPPKIRKFPLERASLRILREREARPANQVPCTFEAPPAGPKTTAIPPRTASWARVVPRSAFPMGQAGKAGKFYAIGDRRCCGRPARPKTEAFPLPVTVPPAGIRPVGGRQGR